MLAVKILGAALTSMIVAWVGAFLVKARTGRGAPSDVPCERSCHTRPTARGGGVGLALALCVVILVLASFEKGGLPRGPWGLVGIASLLVAAVGLWDDYRGLRPSLKYVLQLAAASLVLGAGMMLNGFLLPWGGHVALRWAATLATLFWITGMTNLYNFMDGIDGIAAGVGIIYAIGVAVAAFCLGHPTEGTIAVAIIGACLGFLWFNFPPAKVFMGDVGSLLLGFIFSVLAVHLSQASTPPIPLAFFVIVYSSFIFDTTYTLVIRTWRGEKVWRAHRNHLYQRLVRVGWSHRRVTLLYLALSAVSLALGLAYLVVSPLFKTTLVGVQSFAYVGLVLFVRHRERLAKRSENIRASSSG